MTSDLEPKTLSAASKGIITPQEQEELSQSLPALLEGLEQGNPASVAWLKRWRSRKSVEEDALEQAVATRAEVAAHADQPEQGDLISWCGYPTDLTRCSPFFPMNPRELGQREFLRDFLITSANWGEITYTGPKLSTYEEDALMVLLAVLDGVSSRREVTEEEGWKTYTYKGPALPLLRLLHGGRNPSIKDYERLVSGLKLMMATVVEFSLSGGKTKTGKHRPPRRRRMVNMLSFVDWDEKEKILTATVNPYFYEMYCAGTVTLIDVAKRVSLKGVIAKALYRFVQSHRKNPVFQGHFLTLADALNMDRGQPATNTRRFLKTAISELIRHGILTKKSHFVEQDIVTLERATGALPDKKQKVIGAE